MSETDEIRATSGTLTSPERTDRSAEAPAAAAALAAGLGVAAIGVVTTVAEASTSFADWLAWSNEVGPLSGKSILAVAVWLVGWLVLHPALRGRVALSRGVLVLTGVLLGIGLLGTFPVFFELFAE